jgi:hypothetical protein
MPNLSNSGAQPDSLDQDFQDLNQLVAEGGAAPNTRHQVLSLIQSELPFLFVSFYQSFLFYQQQGESGYAGLTSLACFVLTICVIYSIRKQCSNQYQLINNNVNEKIASVKVIKEECFEKVEAFEEKIDKKVSTTFNFLLMLVLLFITVAILLIGSYAFINFYAGISGLFYLAHSRIDRLSFYPSECLYLLVLALLAVGSNFGLTIYVSGHLHTVLQMYLPILIATCSFNVKWVSDYPAYACFVLIVSIALPTLLVYLHHIGVIASGVFWLPIGVSIFVSLFNIISFFQSPTEIKTGSEGNNDQAHSANSFSNTGTSTDRPTAGQLAQPRSLLSVTTSPENSLA